jgi:L,D-transpeptidase ErfK/SrfK
VDPSVLADVNGLTTQRPLRAGQRLDIDNSHIVPETIGERPIVVNVPQRMLFFLDERGTVAGLPVAVGRPTWRTPLGAFRIASRELDPTWEVPDSIREEAAQEGKWLPAVVPPGPANPLGRFWLGLSLGHVGIHSTNAPASIYTASTHGCIRLHPDDAEWLFNQLAVGVAGTVITEPVLFALVGDDVFLEAHRDVYGQAPDDANLQVRQLANDRGVADRIDWAAVDLVLRRREGIARRVTREEIRTTSGMMRESTPYSY